MAGIEPKYSSQSLGEVHETLKILHKNSNGLMDHPTGLYRGKIDRRK
jgi:hypothetical protein